MMLNEYNTQDPCMFAMANTLF